MPVADPLTEAHRAAGAEFLAYGAVEIVSTFGIPQAEYAAIRKACGLMHNAHRAVLEVGGKDRHAFLNNFLTNATYSKETKTGLAASTGVYAFLLNGKGRIVVDMNVLELGETIYLETDARLIPLLRPALEKYVFTEKVTFKDHTASLTELALHGPNALGILQTAGVVITELQPLASRRVSIFGTPVTIFRDDPCGVPGYHLLLSREVAVSVWQGLSQPYEKQTNKRDLRPVGWAMFNAARIEAGRPLFGIDFSDASLPAETGLVTFNRGVSTTKGCYLGQEVVARMFARNQVAKQLVGLRINGDALPTAGAELTTAEGTQVGTVTSSTLSPILGNASLVLATVKKPFFELNTELQVPAEGAVRTAKVVELPFLKS